MMFLDKRILKTKKALKDALLDLLQEKDFDSISTTQICKSAMVSRNTFYNYYSDKYALLEDCFSDYEETFLTSFEKRQKENNTEHDVEKSFLNLISTFFETDKLYHSIPVFSRFDLASLYYRAVMNILKKYESVYIRFMNPDYDIKQLNSFLIFGVWGFVHGNSRMDEKTVREKTKQLMKDLLRSPIFLLDNYR